MTRPTNAPSARPALFLALSVLNLMATTPACGGSGSGPASTSAPAPTATPVKLVLPPPLPMENFLVAYQDGTGPWRLARSSGANQYSFNITSSRGRYGVLIMDESMDPANLYTQGLVYQLTTLEATTLDLSSLGVRVTADLSMQLQGLASGDSAWVSFGRHSYGLNGPSPLNESMQFSTGTSDLAIAYLPRGANATKLYLQRNLTLQDNLDLGTIDPDTMGIPLGPQSVSVRASGAVVGEDLNSFVDWTSPSTFALLNGGATNDLSFEAVPAGELAAEDFHFFEASASTPATYRNAAVFKKSLDGTSLHLPVALQAPTLSLLSGTRPSFTWYPVANATEHEFYADAEGTFLSWDVILSARWVGDGANPSYTLPDFSTLRGWNEAWNFSSSQILDWQLIDRQTTGANAAYFALGTLPHAEGATSWYTSFSGSFPASSTAASKPTLRPVAARRRVGIFPDRR